MDGKCGAKKKDGGQCKRPAGAGTEHVGVGQCRHHGGSTPNANQNAALVTARSYMDADGVLPDVSPIDGLLYCVQRASQKAMYARRQQVRLETAEGSFDPGQLDADGRVLPWARAEQEQLRDLARFSKMALDAGVAERQVRIAERVGQSITAALEGALHGVDLEPAVRARVVASFSERLMQLEAGS